MSALGRAEHWLWLLTYLYISWLTQLYETYWTCKTQIIFHDAEVTKIGLQSIYTYTFTPWTWCRLPNTIWYVICKLMIHLVETCTVECDIRVKKFKYHPCRPHIKCVLWWKRCACKCMLWRAIAPLADFWRATISISAQRSCAYGVNCLAVQDNDLLLYPTASALWVLSICGGGGDPKDQNLYPNCPTLPYCQICFMATVAIV